MNIYVATFPVSDSWLQTPDKEILERYCLEEVLIILNPGKYSMNGSWAGEEAQVRRAQPVSEH